jgi:DNA-binding NtrC family response regulator
MKKRSLSVLIVDDEEKTKNAMLRSIESLGHSTEVAETCEEGLQKLAQRNFDHAFIEVNLPDGDGVDLMVKAITWHSKINIVAMTENLSLSEEIRIREQRGIIILIKPFPQKLIQEILDHAVWRMGNMLDMENLYLGRNYPESNTE